MIKTSSYFDGQVQSLGFVRHGRRQTVGVIAPGEYHFGTDAPEKMTVVSGALEVRLENETAWVVYPEGTSFEIAGKSGFDVKAKEAAAYVCDYL